MKIVKKTGLVPVLLAGEVIGLKPERARDAIAKGVARLVAIPAGIETEEVPDPVVPAKAEPAAEKEVEIPDDWENLHHLRIWKLACDLAGEDVVPQDGETKTDAAKRVIMAELERRTAPTPA